MSENILANDLEARQRALDPRRSFIVQAPAGSGKTGLLTQRFLRLLGVVQRPEAILAITFTNKAVGEMRQRLEEALREAESEPCPAQEYRAQTWRLARAALERSRRLGWDLLANPSRLQIRTIDSFCAYLAKNLPLSSHLGSSLSPEPDSAWLFQEAAARVVERLFYTPDPPPHLAAYAQKLLGQRFNNDQLRLEEALAQMLQERTHWQAWLQEKGEGLRETLESGYAAWRRMLLESLEKKARELLEAPWSPAARALQASPGPDWPASPLEGTPALWSELASWTETPPPAWRQWRSLSRLLLTSAGALRKDFRNGAGSKYYPAAAQIKKDSHWLPWADLKEWYKDWRESLGAEEGEVTQLLNWAAQALGPTPLEPELWQEISSLIELFQYAQGELRQVFGSYGRCDYDQISAGALRASDPYAEEGLARFSVDNPLQHILVDEYQDTSWSQYRLLNNLTSSWSTQIPGLEEGGRTLFCVGDPMQSIYRFRWANVGVYLYTLQVGFSDDNRTFQLESLVLGQNFRSSSNLVDTLGRSIFQGIFPKGEAAAPEREAIPFSPSVAARPANSLAPIRVFPIISADSLSEGEGEYDPVAYEAWLIAQELQKLRASQPQATCAVLLESKKLGGALLAHLEGLGIACSQKEVSPLAQTPPIPLLWALTEALLEPLQPLPLIIILRSPLVGLNWEELAWVGERYWLGQREEKPLFSRPPYLWQALGQVAKLDLEELQREKPRLASVARRVRRLYGALKRALQERRGWSLAESVRSLWLTLGGREVASPSERQLSEQFFDFVAAYQRQGRWPSRRRLAEDLAKLSAQSPLALENPVQFLTIHGAKGLEFDYVFLPGLGRSQAPPQRSGLWRMAEFLDPQGQGRQLMFMPGYWQEEDPQHYILRAIGGLNEQLRANELVRLFYVAATRAREGICVYPYLQRAQSTQAEGGDWKPQHGDKLLNTPLWQVLRPFSALDPSQDSFLEEYAASLSKWRQERAPAERAQLRALSLEWTERADCVPGWDREERLQIYQPPAPHSGERRPEAPEGESDFYWRTCLGKIIHSLLENLARQLHQWRTPLDDELARRLERQYAPQLELQCGSSLGREERSLALELARQALRGALYSQRGRWVLNPHPQGAWEEAFYRCLPPEEGGGYQKRILDRTFLEGGVRWIIDYKSSRLKEGEELGQFYKRKAQDYREQLDLYAQIIKRCGWEGERVACALYFPLVAEGEGWLEF